MSSTRKRRHPQSHTEEYSRTPMHQATGDQVPSAPANPAVDPFVEPEVALLEVLSTLSHEFRTPLAVIEGFSPTLLSHRQQLSVEEQQESLQAIRQAGRRLSLLTDQLIELVKAEAGAVQLEVGLVDIPALAQGAITLAQQRVPGPLRDSFTFRLQCRDGLGKQTREVPAVKGDALRLRQVLDHLLDNATRFSPQGCHIDVIVRPAPQEGNDKSAEAASSLASFLEICVCDLGPGIAQEHLPHIFEPFYRADTSLTRVIGGLGIGLTLARGYVALHRGRIWAESCPWRMPPSPERGGHAYYHAPTAWRKMG